MWLRGASVGLPRDRMQSDKYHTSLDDTRITHDDCDSALKSEAAVERGYGSGVRPGKPCCSSSHIPRPGRVGPWGWLIFGVTALDACQ
jgi:hypothetical protein